MPQSGGSQLDKYSDTITLLYTEKGYRATEIAHFLKEHSDVDVTRECMMQWLAQKGIKKRNRKSKFRSHHDTIKELLDKGKTDFEIAAFLTTNGVRATQSGVHSYINSHIKSRP